MWFQRESKLRTRQEMAEWTGPNSFACPLREERIEWVGKKSVRREKREKQSSEKREKRE